jgi:hypothetical protein
MQRVTVRPLRVGPGPPLRCRDRRVAQSGQRLRQGWQERRQGSVVVTGPLSAALPKGMTTLESAKTDTTADRRCRPDRDEAMAAYVAQLVNRAPPLTTEQRDRLRRALRA